MPEHMIQPGDRYLRLGNPSTKWVVERLMEFDNQPPHVRLIQDGFSRTITVALSVLDDEGQFQRLDGGR